MRVPKKKKKKFYLVVRKETVGKRNKRENR